MKKLLVSLIATVLLIQPFAAYAEGFNSVSNPDDEMNASSSSLQFAEENELENNLEDSEQQGMEGNSQPDHNNELENQESSLNEATEEAENINHHNEIHKVENKSLQNPTIKTTNIQVKETSTSKLGRILAKDAIIYKTIGDESSSFIAGENYTDKVFYIKKQANYNGELYYLISTTASYQNSAIGWVKAKDIWAQNHVAVDHKNKTFYLKGSGWAYTDPWGAGKDTIYRDLSPFKGQIFKVNLTEKVGDAIWYRGYLDNGKKVWIQAYNVTTAQYSATSKLGRILNQDVRIYKTLGEHSSSFTAGSQYTDKVFYIKKQADINGEQYYLISTVASDSRGVIGWVKAKDMWAQNHVAVDHKNKTFYLKGSGWAYTNPWGAGKDAIYRNLAPFQFETFRVNLTEKVGDAIWYRGFLENGQKVWIQAYNVTTSKPNISSQSTSKLGRILNSNATIYRLLGNHSTSFKAGSQYTDKVFYIKRQANYNGELYYLISTAASYQNSTIGWVKAKDMWAQNHVAVDHNNKTFFLRGTGWAYTDPWGAGKDAIYRDLTPFKGQLFQVNLTEKVGDAIWYRGHLENGRKVWIQAYNVAPINPTSKLGRILNNNSKIYKTLGDDTSSIVAGTQYTDKVFYIKQQVDLNGERYYLISTTANYQNSAIGWVKAKDMWAQDHVAVDHKNKLFVLKGTGWAYTDPWGAGKDAIYRDLTPFKGQLFRVNLTEKVGEAIWYRGYLENGEKVWIQAYNVTAYATTSTHYNISFKNFVDAVMRDGEPKWNGAGTIAAVREEVEYYAHPHSFKADTPEYFQFLVLSQPAGLDPNELNNTILKGKGVLSGQGKAFVEAARKHNINEIYLIQHALHETGNGTSTLAKGVPVDKKGNVLRDSKGNINYDKNHPDYYKTVYNVFGYGAYDKDPINGGAKYAFDNGWFSVSEAIIGGAATIGNDWIKKGKDTLYKMKWSPTTPGTGQYATHIMWATSQARSIYNYYKNLSTYTLIFDVPEYKETPAMQFGKVVTSGSNLNMRSGPSTNHGIVHSIPNGRIMRVYEKNNGWYRVSYDGHTGWVSGEFVTLLN